jgi:hypothetical protein
MCSQLVKVSSDFAKGSKHDAKRPGAEPCIQNAKNLLVMVKTFLKNMCVSHMHFTSNGKKLISYIGILNLVGPTFFLSLEVGETRIWKAHSRNETTRQLRVYTTGPRETRRML